MDLNDIHIRQFRGVINGKAAVLPKFSETLTLSQLEGADYAQLLPLPQLIFLNNINIFLFQLSNKRAGWNKQAGGKFFAS